MTMENEYGVVTAADTVRFERLLPGTIERVWAYLTDPEMRGQWLASGPMVLEEGGAVELHFRHADLSPRQTDIPAKYKQIEAGASFSGRVTRCQPPNVLSYTWAESAGDHSEVTFELSQQGDKVRLVLTHRRLAGREAMLDVASGWHAHLAILCAKLEAREPEPFWPLHNELEEAYQARLD